jgi:glycosyltransferase involved in cell wall biosynthesis
MSPRISLVTPSYQQAAYLEECLASVHGDGFTGLEHIVVDGGSTDGSVEVIARWRERLAWCCSEPDGGQSAAINKGLAKATGDVFNWLNSDDMLLPGALGRVAAAFAADPLLRTFGGARVVLHPDGRQERPPVDDPGRPDDLFIRPRIAQQSTFHRTDAVRAVGGVEQRLRYVMDLELWWQLLFRFGTGGIACEPVELAVFRLHPAGKTSSAPQAFVDETAGVLHRLCTLTGNAALARVLHAAHELPLGLRGFPVDDRHAPIVRRMTWHFLLKWHHRIWSRRGYAAMRLWMDTCPPDMDLLDDEQCAWLGLLRQELAVPGWWAFRLRRKWQHLVR